MDKTEGTLGRYAVKFYQLREHRGSSKSTHTKEPDIDSSLRKFGNPHTPSSLGESCTVAGSVRVLDCTAGVAILAVVAVRAYLRAGLGHALWLGAPRRSVESHLVTGGKVDSLEDVDFTPCDGRIRTRPWCCGSTDRQATRLQRLGSSTLPRRYVGHWHFFWKTPEENWRVSPASVRNVQTVKHPESPEIVLVIGCDHYRISLLVVGHKGCIVDLDNSIACRVHVCELLLEGSCLVDEYDIPFFKGRAVSEGPIM